jgi:hypothetical protein
MTSGVVLSSIELVSSLWTRLKMCTHPVAGFDEKCHEDSGCKRAGHFLNRRESVSL